MTQLPKKRLLEAQGSTQVLKELSQLKQVKATNLYGSLTFASCNHEANTDTVIDRKKVCSNDEFGFGVGADELSMCVVKENEVM